MSVNDVVVVPDGVMLGVWVLEEVEEEEGDGVSVGVRDAVNVVEDVCDGVGENEGVRLRECDGVEGRPVPYL